MGSLIEGFEDLLRKKGSVVLEITAENSEFVANHLVQDINVNTKYKAETVTDGRNYHVIVNRNEYSGGEPNAQM